MDFELVARFIRVSCLPRAAQVAQEWEATHVVSLLDPELDDCHVPVIGTATHHVLRVRDQEDPGATNHFPDLIASLFETLRPIADLDDSRILVHCHAGVSRSTAMAYAFLAHRFGAGREGDAFAALLMVVNKPWPNRRIVEIIDAHLGREGRLLEPLDAMRSRHPCRLDAYHRFNARRGLFSTYSR
ncbi:dual specificity protein phosphatase family protein [Rhizobium sp. ARZ01]|uniref:dual specificity protein phosphatase family protein n=1 Tax=Rhizobium sp. ARZ01 TaxID=2769313 RepID=UPI001781AAF9|nr:dual specificity protein phosphatase family protein [Rhizobium sp. ARZ01]MBD9373271.1 dual specificity protein phosphatase family protein [Rhizobium sp. ARZ01]